MTDTAALLDRVSKRKPRPEKPPTPVVEVNIQELEMPSRESVEHSVLTLGSTPLAPEFDWDHAPLSDCQSRLGDIRREYDRIAAIVLKRSGESRKKWTCWTQLHKDLVPAKVRSLCLKTGDDGRWAYRGDDHFKEVNGIRVPDPITCCNAYCYEMYQRSKQVSGLARH